MTINIITELSSYRENTSELRKFMIDWFDGDVSYNNFIKGIFCGNKNTLEEQADIFTSIDFILENKCLCELPAALLKETICEIDNIWHDILTCYDCFPANSYIEDITITGNTIIAVINTGKKGSHLNKIKVIKNILNNAIFKDLFSNPC